MFFVVLPMLGLMTVYFCLTAASLLLEGIVYYKDKVALILLILLYAINALTINSIINYEWLNEGPGLIFYLIDFAFFAFAFTKYKSNNKLSLIYYIICAGYLSIAMLLDKPTFTNAIYLSFTIIFPLVHLLKIISSDIPEKVLNNIKEKKYNNTCPNCGKKINEKDKFCPICGKNINEVIVNEDTYLESETLETKIEEKEDSSNTIVNNTNVVKKENMIECPYCKNKISDSSCLCIFCGYNVKEKDNG